MFIMYSVFQNTSISCIHLALGCFPVCFTFHILKILTQTKAVIYELATSVLIDLRMHCHFSLYKIFIGVLFILALFLE